MWISCACASSTPTGRFEGSRAARGVVLLTLACAWWFGAVRLPASEVRIVGSTREESQQELARVGVQVQSARSAAETAREQLDAFIARHFEAQPSAPPPAAESSAATDVQPDPALERLKVQFVDLVVRRQELLGYLTDEHPEVVDLTSRIATVEDQIAILGAAPQGDKRNSGRPEKEGPLAARRWNEYVSRQQELRQQDAAEYQRLYDTWQAAEVELDKALTAESAATDRLAATEAALPQTTATAPREAVREEASPQDAGADQQSVASVVPRGSEAEAQSVAPPSNSSGSQPLALAALVLALAVAAVAAVRLARSSADPIFSSPDEVAAALAIPVVGIIPAAASRIARKRVAQRTSVQRRVPFVAQLFVALGLFAIVACVVQNPGGIWQQCHQALHAVTTAARAIGGR